MAKKRTGPPPRPSEPDAGYERIEFQAPIGFTDRLDRAADARGLSRSAYIRQAILLQMKKDERGDEGG